MHPVLLAAACLSTLLATSPSRAQNSVASHRGFQEAVLSVDDLDEAIELYRAIGGWESHDFGTLSPSELAFYGQTGAARTARLSNPGTDRGWIRLIEFAEGRGERIRPSGRTWDTGGIFNVNLRVADIHETATKLRQRGWHGYTEPLQFSFAQFVVWEVLMRGPHDEVLALIQRVEPPLEGWPHMGATSRAFNSTQIVSDFEATKRFYTETLGWQVYFENEGPSARPGPNVLGLPHDLTAEISRKVVIVSPDGRNDGSVEILWFDGLEGADFRDRAVTPHRGWLALRLETDDVDALVTELAAKGASPVASAADLDLAPYGPVRIVAFATPDGARLEFFSPSSR